MATKWMGTILCRWCDGEAKAGIEKDGKGRTYRVMCSTCGVSEQMGRELPAGKMVASLLSLTKSPRQHRAGLEDEMELLRSTNGMDKVYFAKLAESLDTEKELDRLLEAGLVEQEDI